MKKRSLLFLICGVMFLSAFTSFTSFTSFTYAQGNRVGIIDAVNHDLGFISINKTVYAFRHDELIIIYEEKDVRLTTLQAGVQVRYRATRDDVVTEITLLGPESLLEDINNN